MVFHKILFLQDKREVEASLALGLTMRGIQIFQVCKGEGEEYQMVVSGSTTGNAVPACQAQPSSPVSRHRGGWCKSWMEQLHPS